MAIDPNNKFLYFNKDSTSTEMDEALCFPVSSFIGLEIHTSSRLHFFFEGSKGTDATIVRVLHEQYAYQKNFVTALVDEINYGENAFIKIYDHAEKLTHPSDITVNMVTDIVPTFYAQDTDFVISDSISIGGHSVNDIDVAGEFVDSDEHLMTSAAINDRIAAVASGVSVSDSTANTLFPVVFHDESNNLHDDTGAFTYNPSTGSLRVTELIGSDADLNIKSLGGVFFTLDTDSNETNQMFTIGETSSDATFEYNSTKGDLNIYSTSDTYPQINLVHRADNANGSSFTFTKQRLDTSTQAGEDNDVIGGHLYKSYNDAGTPELINYAYTQATIADASDSDEAGKYEIKVTTSDGSTSALQNALTATGSPSANDVDVLLARGTTSTTTIAGDAFVKADIQLGNALDTTLARSAAGKVTIAGNEIVTAGAVNVASGSQAPIGMQVARRTITTGEANSMHSTPIEIVPAQGANTIVIPLLGRMRVDRAATQTNSSADFNMHYEGLEPGTFFQTSMFHIRRIMWNETGDREYNLTGPGGEVAQALTESVNKAVEMSFDAATTTDCFTSIDVFLIYYVVDIS